MRFYRLCHTWFACGLLFTSLLFAGACREVEHDQEQASSTKDIYNNDAQTRHAAQADELVWTVSLGGCTGSMLTPRYLLTANHCNPQAGNRYRTGAALAANPNTNYDLRVVRVAERSSSFDYSIVEVAWINGTPTAGQKYTPFISTKSEDLTLGRDNEATKLFTVGFPVDRNLAATYAEGYAKRYTGNSLYYNVGSINGNSGGAIWRSEDKMLVSQTNFGTHSYGQAGWNNNNPENPNAWNGGGAMYKIYAQSAMLKNIFVDGDNRYVDTDGDLLETPESP